MNDFETELQALIDKHREYPGADLFAMAVALSDAARELSNHAVVQMGVFADDKKFTGL